MNKYKSLNYELDDTLRKFINSKNGFIIRERIGKDYENISYKTLRLLVEDGHVEEVPSGFYITPKGEFLYRQGGFVRQHLEKRILAYCTIAAAICGVITVIISVIALYS